MSIEVGTFTMFDDPVSVVDPEILVAAKAINLPVNKGRFFQDMQAPPKPLTAMEFKVYSRSVTLKTGSITADINNSTVTIPVTADSAKGLTVGHIIEIEDELMCVKSVDRSANTIEVRSRGFAGTTPAPHTNGTKFDVTTYAANQEDLKSVSAIAESTIAYDNYGQQLYEILQYTRYGISQRKDVTPEMRSLLLQEATRRAIVNAIQASVNGVKNKGDGNNPYASAGLFSQLNDTVGGARPIIKLDAQGAALNETILKGIIEQVATTGTPTTIYCNSGQKEIINGFNTGILVRDASSREAGVFVDTYTWNGVSLDVKVDNDIPDSKLAVVNIEKCYKAWIEGNGLRPAEEPALSSDELRESIKGAIGFAIEDVGYEHGFVENLG